MNISVSLLKHIYLRDNLYEFILVTVKCCAASYLGLTIDTGRQKLYYADAADDGGKVGELSTDGTAHRVLFSDVNSIPTALVFDDNNRCPSYTHTH